MSVELQKPADGDWERLAKRLAVSLHRGIEIASSYRADYPDSDVVLFCTEFIVEAEAALKDD